MERRSYYIPFSSQLLPPATRKPVLYLDSFNNYLLTIDPFSICQGLELFRIINCLGITPYQIITYIHIKQSSPGFV